MRILLVSGSAPPMRCGIGDYTDALARALAIIPGNTVAILTSRLAGDIPATGQHPYERIATIEHWSLSELRSVRRAIRSWSPDIVHLQYPTQGYASQVLPAMIPLLAWSAGAVPVRTWHEAFSGRQSLNFLLQSAGAGAAIVVRPNFRELMWPPLRRRLAARPPAMIAGASSIPRSTASPNQLAALRERYLKGQTRLVLFFGFLYPAKGVEQIFEIADSSRDALVIVGGMHADADFAARLKTLAESERWRGKASFTGFLPVEEVADLLAAADAVLLPFTQGGGSWNSSISAAILQGTPVITTARERRGLDDSGRVYFAEPNAIDEMREALETALRAGASAGFTPSLESDWARIATEHMRVYTRALADRKGT